MRALISSFRVLSSLSNASTLNLSASLFPSAILPVSKSAYLSFILAFSSLYNCSCLFHSSTLAVDSCNALVNLALLVLRVVNSICNNVSITVSYYTLLIMIKIGYILPDRTSHFLALAEL